MHLLEQAMHDQDAHKAYLLGHHFHASCPSVCTFFSVRCKTLSTLCCTMQSLQP